MSKNSNLLNSERNLLNQQESELRTADDKYTDEIYREMREIEPGVTSVFLSLARKLDKSIKKHLIDMDLAIKQNSVMYEGFGSLAYKNKNFYIVELIADSRDDNDNKTYSPIQSYFDKSLGYEFFMFRLINGQNSYTPAPNYKIVFDKDSKVPYTKNDVVGSFEYSDGNTEIKAFDDDTHKPNGTAIKILNQDKEHLVTIIKNVFNEYNTQCNNLKTIPDIYKDELSARICQNIYNLEDQDFFIQFVACKEIFTLTYSDDYCETKEFPTDLPFEL